MNRNQITTLDNLVIGDRFYKLGDKKKTVMVVRDFSEKSVTICEAIYFYHITSFYDKPVNNPKEYPAVFLRHEFDIA